MREEDGFIVSGFADDPERDKRTLARLREVNRVECPACKGRKGGEAIYCPGGTRSWRDCYLCKGTGRVANTRAESFAVGERIREYRIARMKSGAEIAQLLSMSARDFNYVETGRVSTDKAEQIERQIHKLDEYAEQVVSLLNWCKENAE